MIKSLKAALQHGLFVSQVAFGIDPRRTALSVVRLPRFFRDLLRYRAMARGGPFPLRLANLFPVMGDFGASAGSVNTHYFHQDLWAARKIHEARPSRHVDVGSRVDGFVAHLLTFMPVTLVDLRPLDGDVRGLDFILDDAVTLSSIEPNSIESLSSLHAVEHFGLGRYGDQVDPEGSFRGMAALQRVLRPGGRLYFSVPIGTERVEFNAHRVHSPGTILSRFASLRLESFAAVDDSGRLDESRPPEAYARASYSCGLFEFSKPRT